MATDEFESYYFDALTNEDADYFYYDGDESAYESEELLDEGCKFCDGTGLDQAGNVCKSCGGLG